MIYTRDISIYTKRTTSSNKNNNYEKNVIFARWMRPNNNKLKYKRPSAGVYTCSEEKKEERKKKESNIEL